MKYYVIVFATILNYIFWYYSIHKDLDKCMNSEK